MSIKFPAALLENYFVPGSTVKSIVVQPSLVPFTYSNFLACNLLDKYGDCYVVPDLKHTQVARRKSSRSNKKRPLQPRFKISFGSKMLNIPQLPGWPTIMIEKYEVVN